MCGGGGGDDDDDDTSLDYKYIIIGFYSTTQVVVIYLL